MIPSAEILGRAEREVERARDDLSSLAHSLTTLEVQDKDPLGLLQHRNAGIPTAASFKVWAEITLLIEMEKGRGRPDEDIYKVLVETSLANAACLGKKDPLRRSTNPISNLCEDLERSAWAVVYSYLTTGR